MTVVAVYHAAWSMGVVPCSPALGGLSSHDNRLSRILFRACRQPARDTPTLKSTSAGCKRRRPVTISPRFASAIALKARPTFSTRPRVAEASTTLPDVNFRIDHSAGRVLWAYRGETYTKHFYPPNLRNLEFTPDSLIGEMDYAGIDMTLLHTNAMLGRSNEYQAECVQSIPRPHPVYGAAR